MKYINEFKKRKYLLFLPLIINLLFLLFLSFRIGDGFLAVHDSPIFLFKNNANNNFLYLWINENFGTTNSLLFVIGFAGRFISWVLLNLQFSTKEMQLIVYVTILNGIVYSAWYSFYKILLIAKKNKLLGASLVGAVLYTYNLYMIASWHGGTIDGLFMLYAFAPYILFITIKILYSGFSLFSVLVLSLIIALTINTGPFAIALYLSVFLSLLITRVNLVYFKNWKYISLFLLLSFFASALSLYLLKLSLLNSDPFAVTTGLNAYAFSNNGISGIFRFFFEWTINQFWRGRFFHSYYPYYALSIVIFSAYILWFLALTPILKNQNKNQKRLLIFLLLIVILSVFIAKATQPPFGFINEALYKYVPLFGIFRTPDTKFGLPVVLIVSSLIAYAYVSIRSNKVRVLMIVLVIIQILPFFSTIPIIEIKVNQSYQRIVKIPDEYKKVSAIINNDSREGRIFVTPGISYGNYNYMNGYGLTGQDILGKLINKPLIYSDSLIFRKSKEKYEELASAFDATRLGDNSIRYILIRKDIDGIKYNVYLKNILNQPNIFLRYNSKLVMLFEINSVSYRPIISTVKPIDIRYVKISPVKYEIRLENVGSKTLLYFLESYHPDWYIYPLKINDSCFQGGKCNDSQFNFEDIKYLMQKPLFNNTHNIFNGFANEWTINNSTVENSMSNAYYQKNPDGTISISMTLYFKQQSYLYLLILVSGGTVIMIITSLLYLRLKHKHE